MVRSTRRTVLKGVAVSGAALSLPSTISAKPQDRCQLNWRKELTRRKGNGKPVINVTQEVVNDIDSGFDGYWAYDDYRRVIQVWDVGEDTYRAVVMYNGQFDGVAGQESPNNDDDTTDVLSGDEHGTMHGGYAATLQGTLRDDPDWPTHGFVGTTDYQGDVEAGTRPGAVRWQAKYFDDPVPTPGGSGGPWTYEWWGWIYRGGKCGTWVNAQSGSCGDIICD